MKSRHRRRLPAGGPGAGQLGDAWRPGRAGGVAPHIVLHTPGNLRRSCVLSGAERCTHGFLP
ncbi:hypothetical protein WI41_14090 [Burkholderia latens]|uniref:Uncharacterized protein n=1 Tax=Burkholderia latens TaxID=488446 RepID=A0AAP1CAY6_9BURK|nr:hypothetical protein WI41_14090 [Burkholderia latens]